MDYQKVLRKLITRVILLLFLIAGIVVLFDPFYQYHAPLPKLKAVLTDKENQVPGSLRNFQYNAVILGSSVVENFNNHWFDEGFSCTTIKAIRASGSTADLLYLLSEAYKHQTITHVFYGLDLSALIADTRVTVFDDGMPAYLYTAHPFDDIPYLFNKEILLEKIPYLLATSLLTDYDEGESYRWAEGKTFHADAAMREAERVFGLPTEITPMREPAYYENALAPNLEALNKMISANKDTEFFLFFPPYSLLWWNNVYENGDLEAYLYVLEKTIESLLTFENVRIYYFQNDREIVTNLNNYMDAIHYSDLINYRIYLDMLEERNQVTLENYNEILNDMHTLIKTKTYPQTTRPTPQSSPAPAPSNPGT